MSTQLADRPSILDPAECWNLVERVAATPSLKRAARLREFLLYVATQSLKEGRNDIHEQEIGETVFGRARAYDTSQDNIVRVSATELRKRVEAYFATEGSAEAIVFEIPRGSYLPNFRLRESTPAPVAQPVEPLNVPAASTTEAVPAHSRAPIWVLGVIAVLLAIACLLLWRQNTRQEQRIQLLEQQHSIER